jgi:hypothetical protein
MLAASLTRATWTPVVPQNVETFPSFTSTTVHATHSTSPYISMSIVFLPFEVGVTTEQFVYQANATFPRERGSPATSAPRPNVPSPHWSVSIQEPQTERHYCCYSFKCTLPSQQMLVRQGHVQRCVLNIEQCSNNVRLDRHQQSEHFSTKLENCTS